ncbi:hypothetical protein Tco_0180433 [Tanacetum coccineum]
MKLEKAKGCKTNKEDANSAEWINVQAMDRCRNYKLAVRLQAQEQEEYQLKKGQDQLMLTTTTNLQSLLTRKSFPEVKDDNFQIIRADGSSKRYSSMIMMLQNTDREDMETLWKLVKAKHRNTRPAEAYE